MKASRLAIIACIGASAVGMGCGDDTATTTDGTGGTAGASNDGGMGGAGNTGNIGGAGNTGNIGGVGNMGGSGPVDECADGTDDCAANASCTDLPDGFQCDCNAGYAGDGVTCADIDECGDGTDNCAINAACTNSDGGFDCACNAGYTGDGVTCVDADECALMTDTCDVNAACANNDGAFDCTCNMGYSGDGMTCADIDECMLDTDNCDVNATCANNVGGFDCACNIGYVGNGVNCLLEGDTCAAAFVVPGVPYAASHDLTGYTNDYQATGCPGNSGAAGIDSVYSFTPAVTGTYRIDVDAAESSPSTLYIATDCADIANTCSDGGFDLFFSSPRRLEATLTAGTTYFIYADGHFGSDTPGAYDISITQLASETVSLINLATPPTSGGGYDGSLATMQCFGLDFLTDGTVENVDDLTLAMDDNWLGDLVVKVVSPAGTTLSVLSNAGTSEATDAGSVCNGTFAALTSASPISFFDGAATDAEVMGAAGGVACQDDGLCEYFPNPGAGPGTNFTDFIGQTTTGTWQMCIVDRCGSIGLVQDVELTITSTLN